MEGSNSTRGRLEIFFEGTWTNICYNYNNSDSQVTLGRIVCRQLGFFDVDYVGNTTSKYVGKENLINKKETLCVFQSLLLLLCIDLQTVETVQIQWSQVFLIREVPLCNVGMNIAFLSLPPSHQFTQWNQNTRTVRFDENCQM